MKRPRVGPPQRKLQVEDAKTYGRVSVHCVGTGISLPELRAHVFRRGFGNDGELGTNSLKLDRSEAEEFLHITNAPMFITPPSLTQSRPQQPQDFAISQNYWVQPPEEDEAASEAVALVAQAQEQLLMATQDIFYFDYGCVVFWGLTEQEEKAALTELATFVDEPVTEEERENSYDKMEFIIDRKANPQKPIRFDLIKMKSLQMEEKLALSYAMAQSSKLFVFESRVLRSLESTRYLPRELATRGTISCSKKELNTLIGKLFVEQTEVNLFSSILDTPDFLWDDDEYLPPYQYTRSYLEVDDRVELLNRFLFLFDLLVLLPVIGNVL